MGISGVVPNFYGKFSRDDEMPKRLLLGVPVVFRQAIYIITYIYIWLVVLTIFKNMKVNGKDYPIYYGK
jgi:hypothetical protein